VVTAAQGRLRALQRRAARQQGPLGPPARRILPGWTESRRERPAGRTWSHPWDRACTSRRRRRPWSVNPAPATAGQDGDRLAARPGGL